MGDLGVMSFLLDVLKYCGLNWCLSLLYAYHNLVKGCLFIPGDALVMEDTLLDMSMEGLEGEVLPYANTDPAFLFDFPANLE